MKLVSMLPILCMFVGFVVAATNVWMIQNGKHKFSSPRGLGLTALTLLILATPLFTLSQLFKPASYVSKVWGFHGAGGSVLWVHSSADMLVGGRLYRVALVDPSGKRTHRLPIGSGPSVDDSDALKILAVTDDKIWCHSDGDGLHSRDPYTATPVLFKKDLLKLYPLLENSAAGDHKFPDGYVLRTRPNADTVELISVPARTNAEAPSAFVAATSGKPATIDGDALVVDDKGLSRAGAHAWRVDMQPTAMTVFEGVLYVGVGGSLLALDPTSGVTRWSTAL